MNGCVIADERIHDSHWLGVGDVYGVCHSTDRGTSWQMANGGLSSAADRHGCAAIFHPRVKNRAYYYRAASTTGAVFSSSDGGANFTPRTTSGTEQNKLGAETAAAPQPRQSGRMIEVDPAGTGGSTQRLFCGSTNGVQLSTDNGATFSTWALAGSNITGLMIDPLTPTRMFVVADSAGTAPGYYEMTGVGSGSTATAVTKKGTFNDPQDVCAAVLPNGTSIVVYIAAGGDAGGGGVVVTSPGIWKQTPGGTPTNITPAGLTTNSSGRVSAVDAQALDSTNMMIYFTLGSTSGHQGTKGRDADTVWRSMNSGTTFTAVTAAAQVHNTINDSAGPNWWLAAGNPSWMPNGDYFDVSQVDIDPNNITTVLLSGRSSPWVTYVANAASASAVQWYPHPKGIGAIAVREICHDPTDATGKRMFATSNDYTAIWSKDGFASAQPTLTGGGGGFSGACDANGIAYVGYGPNNPSAPGAAGVGDVFSVANMWAGTKLAGEGFGAVWDTKGVCAWGTGAARKVLGFSVSKTTVPNSITADGLWLKTGAIGTAGTIVKCADVPESYAYQHISIVRSVNGNIYVFHPANGIYRSATGANGSWSLFDGAPTAPVEGLGSLAVASSGATDILYATGHYGTADQLRRYTGAQAGTGTGTDITPSGVTAPRTVVISTDGGTLYLASSFEGTPPAALNRATTPATSPAWTDLTATDGLYKNMAPLPISMDLSGGNVYVGTLGNGAILVPG